MREIMSVKNLGQVSINVDGRMIKGQAEKVIESDGPIRFSYIIVYLPQGGAYGKFVGERRWSKLL